MMKFIFCNSDKEINNFKLDTLCKKDNIIYYRGPISDITEYYNKNTAIVLPYCDTDDNPNYHKQRRTLVEMLTENEMHIEEIGTAVWVPINEENNFGIAFTSHENTYWALTSVVGLVDKFPHKIENVIFDVNSFHYDKFEEQIGKAISAKKKMDLCPNIWDIYYNP